MSTVNSFDKNQHFGELNSPLFTGNPVPMTPTARKTAARTNLGITVSMAALNQAASITAEARTATADGTGTGAISVGSTVVIVTSAAATNQIGLPGIAANALPIGYRLEGRVGANGFEMITLAASNETINGVDADGTNQLDVAANSAFYATVESATGWIVSQTTLVAPDND